MDFYELTGEYKRGRCAHESEEGRGEAWCPCGRLQQGPGHAFHILHVNVNKAALAPVTKAVRFEVRGKVR